MPKTRRVPQRQCVACGQTRPKRDLVRVVRTPAGAVQIDPTGKLAGRGAYVCIDAACVARALREDRLARVLERPIPGELAEALQRAQPRPAPPRAPVVRRVMLPAAETPPARSGKRQGL